MPWKIVNLDYDAVRPHLHLRDPRNTIHLRAYLDASFEVEVCLGEEHPDDCPVRAVVTPDSVEVTATWFLFAHLEILANILASLDVEPDERGEALAWMSASIRKGAVDGRYAGNVEKHSVGDGGDGETSWPRDLTDDALLEATRDAVAVSKVRFEALATESRRRGLPVPTPPRRPRRKPQPESVSHAVRTALQRERGERP